jgi:bifunctional non-homologous end joining protein LigD
LYATFARGFAEMVQVDSPDRYIAIPPKQQPHDRILVDCFRNGLGVTSLASFSPRARSSAAAAMPLQLSEVDDGLDPSNFTIRTISSRLQR